MKAMTRDGFQLKDNFEWLRAGYDAPFKIANRRSEIWIPVDQIVKDPAAESVADVQSAAPIDGAE